TGDGSGTSSASSVKLVKLADPPLVASSVIVVSSPTMLDGGKNWASVSTAVMPLSNTVFVTVNPVGQTGPMKAAPRHSSLVMVINAGAITGSNNWRVHP